MKRNLSLAVSLAGAAAMFAGGCAPAASTSGGPGAGAAPSAAMVAEGQRLFQGDGRCGVCHGPTGNGGRSGPSLTDAQWIWVRPESATFLQDLAAIIRNGVPTPRQFQTGMPAMGGGQLTESQIQSLAAYVASL